MAVLNRRVEHTRFNRLSVGSEFFFPGNNSGPLVKVDSRHYGFKADPDDQRPQFPSTILGSVPIVGGRQFYFKPASVVPSTGMEVVEPSQRILTVTSSIADVNADGDPVFPVVDNVQYTYVLQANWPSSNGQLLNHIDLNWTFPHDSQGNFLSLPPPTGIYLQRSSVLTLSGGPFQPGLELISGASVGDPNWTTIFTQGAIDAIQNYPTTFQDNSTPATGGMYCYRLIVLIGANAVIWNTVGFTAPPGGVTLTNTSGGSTTLGWTVPSITWDMQSAIERVLPATASSFTMPDTITAKPITLSSTPGLIYGQPWAAQGSNIWIQTAGWLVIQSVSGNQITVTSRGDTGNATAGTQINSGNSNLQIKYTVLKWTWPGSTLDHFHIRRGTNGIIFPLPSQFDIGTTVGSPNTSGYNNVFLDPNPPTPTLFWGIEAVLPGGDGGWIYFNTRPPDPYLSATF